MFLLTINTYESIPSSKRWFKLPALRTTTECNVSLTTFRYSVDNTVNIDCTNPEPTPLLSQIEETKLVILYFICFKSMIKHILLAHCILCEFCANLLPYFMMKCNNYRKHMKPIFIEQIRHSLYV